MKSLISQSTFSLVLIGVVLSVSCSAPPASDSFAEQPIQVDGSSTVYPITEAMARAFAEANPDQSPIEIAFSGTGGGFAKFCSGETVINDASRPISKQEMETCSNNNIRYYELPVAFDAITIVVNPQNDWVEAISMEELKRAWESAAQRQTQTWQQLNPAWPDRPLTLYGPGTDSGTYDYFTDVVVGEGLDSRSDYNASEDDALLVDGVARDPNAMGYFGLAYFEDNQDRLKALAVDSGEGPVYPSKEAVSLGEYQPFSRPLFIYVNAQAIQENRQLEEFVNFYLENAATAASEVGYVPLPAEAYEVAHTQVYRNKVGTAYDGTLEPGLTIGEVLQKSKNF